MAHLPVARQHPTRRRAEICSPRFCGRRCLATCQRHLCGMAADGAPRFRKFAATSYKGKGKMKYYIGPLVFLALAAFAVPAQSELIDWELAEFQPDIPFGGRANTIAVNPSDNHIIFVASESGGLFKTTDGGISWSHVDTLGAYYSSAVAYVTSDILLATTTDRFSTAMTVAAFGAVPMAALTGRTSPIQLR